MKSVKLMICCNRLSTCYLDLRKTKNKIVILTEGRGRNPHFEHSKRGYLTAFDMTVNVLRNSSC